MFHPEVPLWNIAVRTLAVYVLLLGGLRLSGKREIGQMTAFDLVVILLVANAVQNAMVGPDTSLIGGLVAMAVLLAASAAVAVVRERSRWLRRAVEGSPALLVHSGRFIDSTLTRERIDRDDVMMALREHGIERVEDVRLAVLETDGSISVVPVSSQEPLHTRRRLRQRHRN